MLSFNGRGLMKPQRSNMDYKELLANIYTNGSKTSPRGMETKEIINPKLVVDGWNFYASPHQRPYEMVEKYLIGELAWYMSGSIKAEDIVKYSKFWDKLKDQDGEVNSNYGYLTLYKPNNVGYTGYVWALKSLTDDKHSRQAIILYNDRDYYYDGNKDYICT